jgi:hypothetical protein
LQFESELAIEPVESTIMAIFHGSDAPCMEAVAVAETLSVRTPNRAMKSVLMLVVFLTTTALAEVPLVQEEPAGMSMFTHLVDTDVVTVPPEYKLLPPEAALYWLATLVAFTDCEFEV